MAEVFSEDIACIFQTDDLKQVSIVDAISSWCEALYGKISLQAALTDLVQNLGAEAGALVRTYMNEKRPICIASYDVLGKTASCPLDRSYANAYFGKHFERAKPATIWLGSAFSEHAAAPVDQSLGSWQTARQLTEFVVLTLAAGPVTCDHVELHFRSPLTPENLDTLNSILPAVARTWATRQVGLITRTVVNHHGSLRTRRSDRPHVSLLTSRNPAKLSRAEFRVCLLLSRGLTIADTVVELGVTESTVRSHLRNIYAKTNTASIAELIFCLIAPQQTEGERDIRCA